jgi:hypothetical protein
MKSEVKVGAIILGIAFLLAPACIAMAGGMDVAPSGLVYNGDQNLKIVPVVSWSEPGEPIQQSQSGAVRVGRDLGTNNKDDANQFGDDRAYNFAKGSKSREADRTSGRWTPETYGQMGNYGYYSGGTN